MGSIRLRAEWCATVIVALLRALLLCQLLCVPAIRVATSRYGIGLSRVQYSLDDLLLVLSHASDFQGSVD